MTQRLLERLESSLPLKGKWLCYAVCLIALAAAEFVAISSGADLASPGSILIHFTLGILTCVRVVIFEATGE